MSDVVRIRFWAASVLLSLFVYLPMANGDPVACIPSSSLFSLSTGSQLVEDWKKLSRREFGNAILPTDSVVLKKGTELNVVIDTVCLADPRLGPHNLAWLKEAKNKMRSLNRGSPLQSMQWRLDQDWDFYQLQSAFEEEPCVHMVSPEGTFYLNAAFNDPFIKDQTHLDVLHYREVIDEFLLPLMVRRPVTIAIVDTGVDLSHPDLKMNRWRNRGEIPGNGIDDDRNGYIDDVNGFNFASDIGDVGPQGDWPENRHGSHVAGLAAARLDNSNGGIGLNGIAKVMALNVFGLNGFTRSSILENAVRYAADQGVDVINLSLGGREYSRTMRSALEYAVKRGSFIVSAAGNDGIELCDDPQNFDFISPAVYGRGIDGMIVTGSTDTSTGQLSLFSNYSRRLVEISAPGAYTSEGQLLGLLSTTPKNTYGFLAGTSMSAPVVSGAAALVVSWLKAYRYPISPARLERILKESARREPRLAAMIQDGRTLDLRSVLQYLKTRYPARMPK